MGHEEDYDLVLNHITAGELMRRKDEEFADYRQMAHLYLNHKGRHLFESDILQQYGEGAILDKILSQNKHQFVPGANRLKDGKREKTWYDIMGMDVIEPTDDFFDYFFACKLRQIDLLDVDTFLNYQLEKNFDSNKDNFHRFLLLTLRKHKKLLESDVLDTANEWMTNLSKIDLVERKEAKAKGKLKRSADDNLTSLSQVQTALLIHFLQEAKIILKDEYLNNKQAGQAFAALTGYSADTLRQELGAGGIKMEISKRDLEALHNIIVRLEIMIKKRLGPK